MQSVMKYIIYNQDIFPRHKECMSIYENYNYIQTCIMYYAESVSIHKDHFRLIEIFTFSKGDVPTLKWKFYKGASSSAIISEKRQLESAGIPLISHSHEKSYFLINNPQLTVLLFHSLKASITPTLRPTVWLWTFLFIETPCWARLTPEFL